MSAVLSPWIFQAIDRLGTLAETARVLAVFLVYAVVPSYALVRFFSAAINHDNGRAEKKALTERRFTVIESENKKQQKIVSLRKPS